MAGALDGLAFVTDLIAKTTAFNAEKQAGLANMEELRRSADMEESNAVAALRRGAIAAGRRRMAAAQLGGQQKLAYAASNIDASSGTAAQTQDSSRAYAELDAETARNDARAVAFGHKEQARRYGVEASKLDAKYRSGGFFGGTADDQFLLELASSALGKAASFGLGG